MIQILTLIIKVMCGSVTALVLTTCTLDFLLQNIFPYKTLGEMNFAMTTIYIFIALSLLVTISIFYGKLVTFILFSNTLKIK